MSSTDRERMPTIAELVGRAGTIQLTWEVFTAICETLRDTGLKYRSCAVHGFTNAAVMDRIKKQEAIGDLSWKQAWEEAHQQHCDMQEREAYRRAFVGVERGKYSAKGELVGTELEYSDRLAELLMKANRPERFRDNMKLEADVSGGVLLLPTRMSPEEWLRQQGAAGDEG